jgi:glycosyltransferase involved in cell wall biosynthesis
MAAPSASAASQSANTSVIGRNPTVSVVVPVFNNSESLPILFDRICLSMQSTRSELELEVVFVDDGSTDDSWEVIQDLRAKSPTVVSAHKLSRNFGQLSCMLAGYRLAGGDAIVSISADLQDPPELISELVRRWRLGDEVVIANRERRHDGASASITSRIAYALARKSTPGIPPGGFDYFLLSRRATDLLLGFRGRFRFLQGDILWLGLPTSLVPYTRSERPFGRSGYSWSRRLGNFVDLIIDSSYGPIKAMSRIGFLAAALGIVYLLTVIASWLAGGTPFSGWAPIVVLILVMNGTIMVMLGLIGEYVWRIYDSSRDRPIHVIELSLRSDSGITAVRPARDVGDLHPDLSTESEI